MDHAVGTSVNVIACRIGVLLATVAVLAGCGSTSDPAADAGNTTELVTRGPHVQRVGAVLTPIEQRNEAACQQILTKAGDPSDAPRPICRRADRANWFHATFAATEESAWLVGCDAIALDAAGSTVFRGRIAFGALGGILNFMTLEPGKPTELDWFVQASSGVPARLPIDRYETTCFATTDPPL